MRVESAVTSVSWIPSEAVAGLAKMGFTAGAVRYDDPPPDRGGGGSPAGPGSPSSPPSSRS